jgi:putative tryptophan/tyrosine transport system substrate-binding protein
MRRRDFLGVLSSAVAWPIAVRAQQARLPVIGYLGISSPDLYAERLRAFRQGLNESGYVEGRNVAIEFCWADDHEDRLPALASDLVRRQVAVIVTGGGTPPALAAKAATAAIPIVFAVGTDPIALGLVASLNRPGGNLTGVTVLNVEVEPKRVELLHVLLPAAVRFAVLVNPANPIVFDSHVTIMQAAAHKLGLQMNVLNASTSSEIDTAFTTLAQRGATALVISGDQFMLSQREQIVALAARHSIPTIYDRREFTKAGGLMSYGASVLDAHRQIGVYTGRILKGEKPGDLPVMQSTKFDLVINLKTANALGLTIPPLLLALADEVIE